MKKSVIMPEVIRCETNACVYNDDSLCHARAITVGNGGNPACDTAWLSDEQTDRVETAGVGACRTVDCAMNNDFECQADCINVIFQSSEAICGTYTPG